MKQLTLAAVAIAALAGQAHAEMEFVAGSSSIEYTFEPGGTFYTIYGDTSAAFTLGDWGGQVGASATYISGTTFISLDGHFYRTLQNGAKIGGFVNMIDVTNSLFADIGGEAMFSLGAVDIQASAGVLTNFADPVDTGTFDVTAYYEITPGIEISGQYAAIFEVGGPGYIDSYGIGASYQIPNSAFVATANYQYFNTFGAGIATVGLSWNYGPRPDTRLFNHGSAFFDNLGLF